MIEPIHSYTINVVPAEPVRLRLAEREVFPIELLRWERLDRDSLMLAVETLVRDINLAHLTFPC